MKKYINRHKESIDEIVKAFKEHCAEGWSATSFAAKLKGGGQDLTILRKMYPEFEQAYFHQTKQQRIERVKRFDLLKLQKNNSF